MKWLEGKLLRINDPIAWVNPRTSEILPVLYKGYVGRGKVSVQIDGVSFTVRNADLRLRTHRPVRAEEVAS